METQTCDNSYNKTDLNLRTQNNEDIFNIQNSSRSSTNSKKILQTYISQIFCCIGRNSERTSSFSDDNYKSSLPKSERKPRSTPLETIRKESMLSPRSTNGPKTLVLDLDETLIHAFFEVKKNKKI